MDNIREGTDEPRARTGSVSERSKLTHTVLDMEAIKSAEQSHEGYTVE
jgi:hypothetical protein